MADQVHAVETRLYYGALIVQTKFGELKAKDPQITEIKEWTNTLVFRIQT